MEELIAKIRKVNPAAKIVLLGETPYFPKVCMFVQFHDFFVFKFDPVFVEILS